MEKYIKKYKKVINSLYLDKATFYTIEMKINTETKVKEPTMVVSHADIPCRLSFKEVRVPIEDGKTFKTEREDKLFVDSDVFIKPGSKVEIQRHTSKVYKYDAVGLVRDYPTHNEYPLLQLKEVI